MTTSMESTERESRLLAIAAARLRSDGLKQAKIAERLGKSQPEVSRLLAEAEEQHFLARSPAFLSQNIPAKDLEDVERRFFSHAELRKRLWELVPSGRLHFDVRVFAETGHGFAFAAAGRVATLLRRAKRIGVMWGGTISRLVEGVKARRDLFEREKIQIEHCIPLSGDPVFLINQGLLQYSSSHLAAELGQALNAKHSSPQPCLLGVPGYIARRVLTPKGANGADWDRFVQAIPGYRAIFGGSQNQGGGLVEAVDTIITGTGIVVLGKDQAWDETGDFIQERLAQEGMAKEALSKLVYGDIGGLLLERKGLKPSDKKLVEELNRGWTGIQESHLQAVAKKADREGPPGIILVATGAAKAEMVVEIIRRGYVNELLIDADLGTALLERA